MRRSLARLALGTLLAGVAAVPLARAEDQGEEKKEAPALGNWYVSGFGSGVFLQGAKNIGSGGNPLDITDTNAPGYGFRGAFGGYRTPQVRIEGEVGYYRGGFSGTTVFNDGGLGKAAGMAPLTVHAGNGTGQASALSFMANVYYDYDTNSPWRPYFDFGLGFARVGLDNFRIAGVPIANDSGLAFAYQLGLGLGYEITKSTTIVLDYRYFATLDPTLRDAAGGSFTTDFTSHQVALGIRYRF